MPNIDWGGDSPQAASVIASFGNLVPAAVLVYSGGILVSPRVSQLIPPPPEGLTMFAWQSTITDAEGNVVPGAGMEVRSANTNSLVPLFSNRAGTAGLTNPFQADPDGFARFYVPAGVYRIRAFSAGLERVWADVLVGVPLEAVIEATGPLFSSQQQQLTNLAGEVDELGDDLSELLANSRPAVAYTVGSDGTSGTKPETWTTSRVSTGLYETVHGLGTTAYHPKIQPVLGTDTNRVYGAVLIQKLTNSFRYRISSIHDESDGGTDVTHEVAVFLPLS
jgi:hypothetical protein